MQYVIIVVRHGRAHFVAADGTGQVLVARAKTAKAYINAYADSGDFAMAYSI